MKRSRYAVAVLALLVALPSQLMAHGNQPPYIAFWGPFPTATARCQRQIGSSTDRCVRKVLQLELSCAGSAQSTECSPAAKATARQAAIASAQSEVATTCSPDEVQALLFRDRSETETDLALACGAEPQNFATMMLSAESDQLTPACRQTMAIAGRLFVRSALRGKRAALNRIALHQLQPSQRLARINDCRQKMSRLRQSVGRRLLRACPDFEATTQRSPEAWLVDLELRVDCVIFAGYIQSAFTCPR